MCAYKRIFAKKTHISAQEPHCAPWARVITCLQVCLQVWCFTVCLPECSKSVRSENSMSDLKIRCPIWKFDEVMRCKRAPYLRERASLCTLMRSETRLCSNSCMSIETYDLEFQKTLVCRSLCACKETHVSVLMLACTLSTARFLSKKNAHVDEDCEHTDNVWWGQIAINMGHFSVYVRQRLHRVQARVMFPYTSVLSLFTMIHVCIYVVHTWIYVSIYTLYTWIRVSIYMNHVFYTYNREYTKHKLQPSCSYIHASCLYLQYVVSLYMRTSASSPSAS